MYQAEYKGINAFLRETCRLILMEGVCRETRGRICYELPQPMMIKITHPTARLVTIPERNWYAPLAYGESLWLASGRNNMDYINLYGSNMRNFSDNGETMRGGYGPRFRHYNGCETDYDIHNMCKEMRTEVDQFRYVVECFKKDINTRQAIINIGDPVKDCFNEGRHLKVTKDIPCTRMLHFIKDAKENKLNLIVSMRSNEILDRTSFKKFISEVVDLTKNPERLIQTLFGHSSKNLSSEQRANLADCLHNIVSEVAGSDEIHQIKILQKVANENSHTKQSLRDS